MILQRLRLTIDGMVQGVGFRPFVYTLANRCNLSGFVGNHSGGVFVEIEGDNKLPDHRDCEILTGLTVDNAPRENQSGARADTEKAAAFGSRTRARTVYFS